MNWKCNSCQAEFEIKGKIEEAACPICGARVVLPEGVSEEDIPEEIKPSGPWTRFAARILIDTYLEQMFAAYVFLACLKVAGVSPIATAIFIALLICPLGLLLDSIIYAVFGNTLGKWATCVRHVDASDGQKISAGRYFVRNIRVFISGFGLDIPIVKLIAFIVQYLHVSRGEQSTYDEKAGIITVEVNQSIKKRLLAWAVIILVQSFLATASWYIKTRG